MAKTSEPSSFTPELKRAILYLLIVIIVWGINYTVGRLLSAPHPELGTGFTSSRVSGVLYGFFRYFFGALTMIAVLLFQRRDISDVSTEIKPYRRILFASAVFSAIFILAAHASNEFISSGTTSIIINMCPVLVLIYGVIYLKEPLSRRKLAGFILGVTGGIFFLWNSYLETSVINTVGILLALLAMLSWAAYTICLHYLEGGDSYIIMTVKHVSATVMIIPFLALYAVNSSLILVIDLWTITGLFFAGVIASGLAYILYFKAIEIMGAPRASSVLFLIPVVSVLGDVILQELPGLITLTGGVATIIGVALINSKGRKE